MDIFLSLVLLLFQMLIIKCDGVGVMCEVYESKKEDEFGKIVAMYKGKGNHRFKSIKFADEK